jgi:outer membrane protein assembly factor BamA
MRCPRLARCCTALLVCVTACLCTPRRLLAETTLIPVPEIIVDPNEGTTVGFLPVLLIAGETKAVRSIIAPDVRYNDITGVYPTLRFFDYPDPKQKYLLTAGKGTSRGEDAEAQYVGQDLFQGWLDFTGRAQHEQDPFERFFGFGNDTPDSNETNFTSTTNAATAFLSLNLPASLQASLQTRLRHVRIGQGGVTDLPQLRDPNSGFSTVKGADGGTVIGERLGLAYDTRDLIDIPTQGVFGNGSIEVVDRALGSSFSFVKYGLEGKAFVPLRADKKFILALHGEADYLQNGQDTPFFEKNSVGGIHSLRGFGSNRFTDNHRFFMQAELRTSIYEREIFGVRAHLELAPFLDLGKVFHSAGEFPLEDLHVVGGMGLRAVVVPQVVAYIDFGTEGGGPAAFTGIDYPF